MAVVTIDWVLLNSPRTARSCSYFALFFDNQNLFFPDGASQEVSVADPNCYSIGGITTKYLRVPDRASLFLFSNLVVRHPHGSGLPKGSAVTGVLEQIPVHFLSSFTFDTLELNCDFSRWVWEQRFIYPPNLIQNLSTINKLCPASPNKPPIKDLCWSGKLSNSVI